MLRKKLKFVTFVVPFDRWSRKGILTLWKQADEGVGDTIRYIYACTEILDEAIELRPSVYLPYYLS